MEAVRGALDPWVDLRGPDSHLVKYNDDIDLVDLNSRICSPALPETGDYTVVARSFWNDSTGSFKVTVQDGAGCIDPTPICHVVTIFGLNLRRGPGTSY